MFAIVIRFSRERPRVSYLIDFKLAHAFFYLMFLIDVC